MNAKIEFDGKEVIAIGNDMGQYITPDLFTHLIKREWGMVKGYIECKEVRQT